MLVNGLGNTIPPYSSWTNAKAIAFDSGSLMICGPKGECLFLGIDWKNIVRMGTKFVPQNIEMPIMRSPYKYSVVVEEDLRHNHEVVIYICIFLNGKIKKEVRIIMSEFP